MNFLPGWHPGFSVAGGISFFTFIEAASVTMNDTSSEGLNPLTIPASVRAGDVLVYAVWDINIGNDIAGAAISGWTQAVSFGPAIAQPRYHAVFARVADGTEGGTTISGGTSNGRFRARMVLVFRPDVAAVSLTIGSAQTQYTSANPAPQLMDFTTGAPVAPLIAIGSYGCLDSGSAVNPRTFTVGGVDAKDGEAGITTGTFDNVFWLAWRLYSAGVSLASPPTIDMDDEGSDNFLASFFVKPV